MADEIEGVDTSQFDKPPIYQYAVALHIDLVAYMDAGFSRDEAYEIVRNSDAEHTSFLYDLKRHALECGGGGDAGE